MVEEYKERKQHLQNLCDRKIAEYEFIESIVTVNTLLENSHPVAAPVIALEVQLSKLDYENIAASFPLDFWRVQYGDNMIIPIIADIMHYFLRQFQVKELMTDVQIIQLAVKLMAQQPKLRIMELVFVFNQALQGAYGPTYQRIGIDTILGWLSKFYEESAAHLEATRINSKPDDSRGDQPWVVVEKKLKAYEQEQRAKKEITDKIWGIEKRLQHVKEEKVNILSQNQSK